jgi:hypothetical protein
MLFTCWFLLKAMLYSSYILWFDCHIVNLDINPTISYYMSYSNQGSALKTAFAPIIMSLFNSYTRYTFPHMYTHKSAPSCQFVICKTLPPPPASHPSTKYTFRQLDCQSAVPNQILLTPFLRMSQN